MKLNKILFPTDFSTTSDSALQYASVLAREFDALLIICHVEEHPLAYAGGEMYYGVLEPDTEALTKMLSEVVPTVPGVRYEHRLLMGEPAAAVRDLAVEEGADLIVMGTHGRTGLRRMLMGSVAEEMVRVAPCPVFSLKQTPESIKGLARPKKDASAAGPGAGTGPATTT